MGVGRRDSTEKLSEMLRILYNLVVCFQFHTQSTRRTAVMYANVLSCLNIRRRCKESLSSQFNVETVIITAKHIFFILRVHV
jgi:hypothetical protein